MPLVDACIFSTGYKRPIIAVTPWGDKFRAQRQLAGALSEGAQWQRDEDTVPCLSTPRPPVPIDAFLPRATLAAVNVTGRNFPRFREARRVKCGPSVVAAG